MTKKTSGKKSGSAKTEYVLREILTTVVKLGNDEQEQVTELSVLLG
jgi:hypothetical protein